MGRPKKKVRNIDIHSDEIDWAGLQTAAVAVGLREAARQATRYMEEPAKGRMINRILRRSTREGWMKEENKAVAVPAENGVPVRIDNKPVVVSGANVVAAALAEQKRKSEAAIAKAIVRKAEYLADILDPADIPAVDLNHVTTAHNKLYNSDQESQKTITPIQINIG